MNDNVTSVGAFATNAWRLVVHTGRMRIMMVVLVLAAFTIWDVSMNRSQYTGPVFSFARRVATPTP